VRAASRRITNPPQVKQPAPHGCAAEAASTTVELSGDVQVGGTIANVGQRLIETTAKMIIARFFAALVGQASRPVPPEPLPNSDK